MQQKRIFNDKYDEFYSSNYELCMENYALIIKILSSPPLQFCRALMAWR